MKARTLFFLTFALSAGLLTAADKSHKLSSVKQTPKGLSAKVAAVVEPAGYRIVGPKGTVFEIWLVKSLDVKPGFKATLNVKYPFTSGQLFGVLRVAEKSEFTDFRGQEVAAGVYTLRYGQQPEDGNHIGTSELADFRLAIPAKFDADPKPLNILDELHMRSAKTAGSTHPAIFSLLPAGKPAKTSPNRPRGRFLFSAPPPEFYLVP